MMQQKIKSQAKNTDANQASNSWTRWWPFFAAALLIFVLPIMLVVMKHQQPNKQAPDRLKAGVDQSTQMTLIPPLTERALKDTAWDTAWPPLPNVGTPSQPIEQVRAMYAFAARHSEVLEYAPCYCGCESGGHKSARDCFVKGRTADGKPQWDEMGFI